MPLGQCMPVARGENMASGSRIGETFSHFVSVEFDKGSEDYQKFRIKVKGMQDLLVDVPGIGKAVKPDAFVANQHSADIIPQFWYLVPSIGFTKSLSTFPQF